MTNIEGRHKASERSRDFKKGTKPHISQQIQKYLKVAHTGNNPEKELRFAREIGDFNGALAKLQCAKALAGTAFRHAEQFGSITALLFSQAHENAQIASDLDSTGLLRHKAEKLKLSLPIYSQISEGLVPSLETIEANAVARKKMLPGLLENWTKAKESANHIEIIETVGALSEEAVELMLSRYVINHSVGGFIPVASVFSQDCGRIANSTIKSGWDISIFTNYPEFPTLAHRLQVKTTPKDDEYVEATDFDIVSVSDLRIPTEKHGRTTPEKILNEILCEHEGTNTYIDPRQARAYLDCRTEVLLDIFS